MTFGRVAAGAVLLAVGVTAGCGSGHGSSVAPGAAPRPSVSPTPLTELQKFRSTRTFAIPAKPVRVRVPAVGIVSKGEEDLQRKPDGSLPAPTEWDDIGWYAGGPRPGQAGPAVILGHVDSKRGPAVFKRLPEVTPGTPIYVDLADHTTLTFLVDKVLQYPKVRFPTDQVYYPDLNTSLRLITCGGAFNEKTRHYEDNIIAYATLQE